MLGDCNTSQPQYLCCEVQQLLKDWSAAPCWLPCVLSTMEKPFPSMVGRHTMNFWRIFNFPLHSGSFSGKCAQGDGLTHRVCVLVDLYWILSCTLPSKQALSIVRVQHCWTELSSICKHSTWTDTQKAWTGPKMVQNSTHLHVFIHLSRQIFLPTSHYALLVFTLNKQRYKCY